MIVPNVRSTNYSGDLFSVMFSERILFVTEDITKQFGTLLVAELMYLDSLNNDPITIQISSNGGDIDGLNMILDAMDIIKSDIITINMGAAYSCAALILLSGTKGKRYAFPNSRVLLHQPLSGTSGMMQTSDLQIKVNELQKAKNKIRELILKRTKMSEEEVDKALDRDTYFNAEEALKTGLIDSILINS